METSTIILLVLLTVHLALALYAIIRVVKTVELTKKQKLMNILLTIFIPFIWSTLMYYMFKKMPESYEIDPKDKFTSNDFYESGIAITPAAQP